MDRQRLVENGALVSVVYKTITYGGESIKHIPGLIKRLISENRWQAWFNPSNEEVYEFDDFRKFVEEKPHKGGLGIDIDTLRTLCKDDDKATSLIQSQIKGRSGPPEGNQNAAKRKTITDNISNCFDPIAKNAGTSKESGHRRLNKEALSNPKAKALQQKVFENAMSVHAALIELGIRDKTITVPLHPHKAAAALKRHFDTEGLAELITLLQST